MAMSSVIKKCGCKGNPSHASDYQDKKYGHGMRVCMMNEKKDTVVCSVCGTKHRL